MEDNANLVFGIQWSSQGRHVRLIDSQSSQLQDSIQFINDLRKTADRDPSTTWGTVSTHSPDDLVSTLKDTWLVVEVSHALPIVLLLNGPSAPLTND